jgi:cytochrome c-type biogenesis protein
MFEEYLGMFFMGLATFFSPCSIALITVYLTYTLGVGKTVGKGFVVGTSFALAMITVFFFIGMILSMAGSFIVYVLTNYKGVFFGISGILLILFGVKNLGLQEKIGLSTSLGESVSERLNAFRLNAMTRFSRYNYAIGSFLFGVIISLAVGPCSLSLVLSAMLIALPRIASMSIFHGGLLLSIFGLGNALPVIFLSVMLATARKAASEKIGKTSERLTKVFGLVFLIIGIIIIAYALVGM